MDKVRVPFFILVLFVYVFVLGLVVVRSEGNRKLLETISGNNDSFSSQDELDQETVEQMVHCWKKIDYNSKTTPDFRQSQPYEIAKAITILAPNMPRTFLDCLNTGNLFPATPNKGTVSTIWLEKFFDHFLDFSSIPRRHLLGENHPYHHQKKQTDDETQHRQEGKPTLNNNPDSKLPDKVPQKPRPNNQGDENTTGTQSGLSALLDQVSQKPRPNNQRDENATNTTQSGLSALLDQVSQKPRPNNQRDENTTNTTQSGPSALLDQVLAPAPINTSPPPIQDTRSLNTSQPPPNVQPPPSPPPPASPEKKKHDESKDMQMIYVAGAILVGMTVLALLCLCCHKCRNKEG